MTHSSSVIRQALLLAQASLRQFAADPAFLAKLSVPFGPRFSSPVAQQLRTAWLQDDFTAIPAIEVLPALTLKGAVGAYAQATDRIYLSQQFLARHLSNIGLIASVLLEEIGHKLDGLLNIVETPTLSP